MSESNSQGDSGAQELHLLKDKWFVFYIPASKGEDYEHQTKELGYVTSIEEVYSTINTLPPITLLPNDDNLVFSRNKIEPQFESFPGGRRFSIFCKTKTQCREALTYVLAVVLGEAISKEACNGECPCDIVRVGHKGSVMYKESVRIEVWAHKNNHNAAMERYLNSTLSLIPGVQVNSRPF